MLNYRYKLIYCYTARTAINVHAPSLKELNFFELLNESFEFCYLIFIKLYRLII